MDYLKLLKGADLFQKLPKFDIDYKKYVLDHRQIWENLDQITESDVERTVIEFLKAWKIRNVGRINISRLKETLQELNGHFKVLRGKTPMNFDFDEQITVDGQSKKNSEIIKEIYRWLIETTGVGPTSASKIMHCVILELFMMWDDKIRNDMVMLVMKSVI